MEPRADSEERTRPRPPSRHAPGAQVSRGGPHLGLTRPPRRALLGFLAVASLRALGRLPLRPVQAIGGAVGWLASLLPIRERRVTEVNLRIAFPELDEQGRRRLARRSMIETGRNFAEFGVVWSWTRERLDRRVTRVSGEGAVVEALRRGRGVIVAAPHLGDWEVAGLYVSSRFSMTTLYRPPRVGELESFVRRSRGRFGATMVPANRGAARALLRALNRGEVVAILPDQDAGVGMGVFVPFFGELANTMVLLPRLAARSGAPVFIVYAERLRRGRFHVHFVPAADEVGDPDVARAAASMNRDVERCVRAHPEQYLWSYKRYRIRPPGMRDPYRESDG